MREMDCVEVMVEKEKYAKDGVHKGMQGWICDPDSIDGTCNTVKKMISQKSPFWKKI